MAVVNAVALMNFHQSWSGESLFDGMSLYLCTCVGEYSRKGALAIHSQIFLVNLCVAQQTLPPVLLWLLQEVQDVVLWVHLWDRRGFQQRWSGHGCVCGMCAHKHSCCVCFFEAYVRHVALRLIHLRSICLRGCSTSEGGGPHFCTITYAFASVQTVISSSVASAGEICWRTSCPQFLTPVMILKYSDVFGWRQRALTAS